MRAQLGKDLAFAIEKAEDQRGISANLMFEVIVMWMWILEDPDLANERGYCNYGLAYLRRVEQKYPLPTPAKG